MVTRRVHVFDPAVVTVAHLQAGSTNNVIPGVGVPRGDDPHALGRAAGRRRRGGAAGGQLVAAAHELGVEFEHRQGYPVTVNDAGPRPRVLDDRAPSCSGEPAAVLLAAPLMGAEDFSYVLQRGARRDGVARRAPAGRRPGRGAAQPLEPGRSSTRSRCRPAPPSTPAMALRALAPAEVVRGRTPTDLLRSGGGGVAALLGRGGLHVADLVLLHGLPDDVARRPRRAGPATPACGRRSTRRPRGSAGAAPGGCRRARTRRCPARSARRGRRAR